MLRRLGVVVGVTPVSSQVEGQVHHPLWFHDGVVFLLGYVLVLDHAALYVWLDTSVPGELELTISAANSSHCF